MIYVPNRKGYVRGGLTAKWKVLVLQGIIYS